MANFNQVILIGNLTRQPALSYLPNQTPVTEFGLAVNRRWRREDGSQADEVCYVECQAFGKRAEVISKHLGKGSPIFVRGRLKFEQWQKDDQTHSRLRVVVEDFEFIGPKREADTE